MGAVSQRFKNFYLSGNANVGAVTSSGSINLTGGQVKLRNDVALDHDGSALYVKAPTSIYFYPGNTNKGNIDTTGNLTLSGKVTASGLSYLTQVDSSEFRNTTRVSNATTPANTAGWFKIAKVVRGGGRILLSFTGGNYTPDTFVIDYYRNWSSVGSLFLKKYQGTGFITKARIRQDSGDSNYYVEIYCASNSNGLSFQVYHQRLQGYASDSNTVYGGSLSAGSTSGTDIVSEQSFISKGTWSEGIEADYYYGNVNIHSGNLKFNGTTVIDSSRSITTTAVNSTGSISINQGGSFSKLDIKTSRTGATDNIGGVQFYNSSNTQKSQLYGVNDGSLKFATNGSTVALTLDSSQNATFTQDVTIADNLKATGNNLKFHAGGTHVLNIDLNGKIYPETDAVYDLGFAGSRRFRHAYFTQSVNAGSFVATGSLKLNPDVGNDVEIAADGSYGTSGSGRYVTIGFGGTSNGSNRIFAHNTGGDGIYIASATGRNISFRTNGAGSEAFRMTSDGKFQAGSSNTTILDASRNLQNIASISSGAITTTGDIFVGNTNNKQIRVRHIEGKDNDSNDYGGLFLNYNSTYNVQIGHSGNNNDLHIYGALGTGGTIRLDNSGNLSNIGTITTSGNIEIAKDVAKLTINNNSANTQASLDLKNTTLHARYILDSDDLFRIYNQTSSFDAFAVKSSGDVHVYTGALKIGTNNTTSGSVDVYGGSSGAEGGEIRLHTTNSNDSTYEWYRIDAYADDFRIGRQGQTDLTIDQTGKANFGGLVSCDDGFQINGTTVIDASRALTSINHITTGGLVKINASGSTSSSIKLLVGTTNSSSSSAIAQFGGFLRAANILFLHDGAGSGNSISMRYTGGHIDLTQGEGSGGTPATRVNSIASPDGTQLVFPNNSGRVGIGIASPSALVHAVSNDSTTNDAVNMMILTALSTGTTTTGFGPAILLQGERNNGVTQNVGRIRSVAEVNSGTNISSGLAFESSVAGVLNERVRISYDGKVGIGTTSPANLLSIESTGQFAGMNIKSASSNGVSYIDFGDADDNNIGGINYDNSTNLLQFRNGNTNHAFLNHAGRFGLGTGNPQEKLHVAGTIRGDEYKLGSTTVINSSRNISNIGTIDSTYITSTSTDIALNRPLQVKAEGGNSATNGGIFLRQQYSGDISLSSFSSAYSSGDLLIGAGMAYKSGASGIVSTFANFSDERSGIRVKRGQIIFVGTSGAVQTAVGSTMTTVDTFTHDTTDGDTTITGSMSVGDLSIGNTTVINGARQLTNIASANVAGNVTIDYTGNGTNDAGLFVQNDASDWGIRIHKISTHTYGMQIDADGSYVFRTVNSSGTEKFRIDGDGDIETVRNINSSGTLTTADVQINSNGIYLNNGNYRVGTTAIVDSSRNLINIGTIDSGVITATNSGNAIVAKYNASNYSALRYDGVDTVSGGDGVYKRAGSEKLRLKTSGVDVTGTMTASADVVAYSDERLKSNIQTLDGKKALQMRGVSFEKDGVQSSGVIAQEIEKIAPELVHTNNDEMKTKSVAYGNLVGYLIEAVKEQQEQIKELQEQVQDLTRQK